MVMSLAQTVLSSKAVRIVFLLVVLQRALQIISYAINPFYGDITISMANFDGITIATFILVPLYFVLVVKQNALIDSPHLVIRNSSNSNLQLLTLKLVLVLSVIMALWVNLTGLVALFVCQLFMSAVITPFETIISITSQILFLSVTNLIFYLGKYVFKHPVIPLVLMLGYNAWDFLMNLFAFQDVNLYIGWYVSAYIYFSSTFMTFILILRQLSILLALYICIYFMMQKRGVEHIMLNDFRSAID